MSSRQDVMLAALTLSFLEGLEQDGIERRYAIELTGDVYWHLYRQAGYVNPGRHPADHPRPGD